VSLKKSTLPFAIATVRSPGTRLRVPYQFVVTAEISPARISAEWTGPIRSHRSLSPVSRSMRGIGFEPVDPTRSGGATAPSTGTWIIRSSSAASSSPVVSRLSSVPPRRFGGFWVMQDYSNRYNFLLKKYLAVFGSRVAVVRMISTWALSSSAPPQLASSHPTLDSVGGGCSSV